MNADMMPVEKKQRAKRTPRNNESIFKGALSLPLIDRVELKNNLEESIRAEVETMQEAAKQAALIANGTK